jgi:hypothetical protein
LTFEPIHRLLYNLNVNILDEMRAYWGDRLSVQEVLSTEQLMEIVDQAAEPWHQIGMVSPSGLHLIEIHNPDDNLPVGTLQNFLDQLMDNGHAEKIDYVHGSDVLLDKGPVTGNVGFYVPGMDKSELFKTVILDGALPRKTFFNGRSQRKALLHGMPPHPTRMKKYLFPILMFILCACQPQVLVSTATPTQSPPSQPTSTSSPTLTPTIAATILPEPSPTPLPTFDICSPLEEKPFRACPSS